MGAGLPVVTTNIGGGREVVSAACGILVDASPEAFAAALSHLVGDPARRISLASAGPLRARELCDPELRMAQLEGLLAQAVRNGS
jgi:glycosyltransferase involved in cell wall biosynthesis